MKLRSGYSTEWLSKINTIDLYGLNGWCVQVFLTCPLLINAQFPPEFGLNWVRPGQEGDGSRDAYIPDDKSFQDWIDNPRPCLLRLGELILYAEFKKWYEEVLWDDYTVLGGWDYSIQMYYAVTMPDAMQVVRATMKIRQQLSDKQLRRFLNEWWRQWTYNETIRVRLVDDLYILGEELRPQIAEAAEVLQAYLDDEMANFVWPEGDRMVGFRTHYEADRRLNGLG